MIICVIQIIEDIIFIFLSDFIDCNQFMNDLISCAYYMQLSVIIEANFKFSFLCSFVTVSEFVTKKMSNLGKQETTRLSP